MTVEDHVALFDFDGTITYRDTLMPFLLEAAPPFRLALGAPAAILSGAGLVLKLRSRDSAKQAVISALLGGMRVEDFGRACRSFAGGPLRRLVRPAALETIAWHRRQGHRLVLVSASLEAYLEPWAESAGFDGVLATRLAVREGCLTGDFDGANCRGAEKARRIHELLGDLGDVVVHAYGDSKGDREMLALANFAHYRDLEPA